MSLRFRRRIKLLPGVHLNISRSGISTSVGVRGASVTIGKRGTYLNAGIPGTGISSRSRIDHSTLTTSQAPGTPEAPPSLHHHVHWWKLALFFGSMIAAGLTKNNTIIGLFWCAWFGYWIFLILRKIFQKAPQTDTSKTIQERLSDF